MKKLLFLFGLAFLFSYHLFAQVPNYNVTMTQANYESLYTRSIWSDVRLPAPFTSNDTLWSGSNIRFKGHSTRYFPKKAYRVRFATSQLFYGNRDMNFNAMYTDKSSIREKLAWDLFADMGAVAPFCYHSKFSINNEPKGLFAFLDKIDSYFLINRGFTPGPLYEANDTWTMADLTVQPDSLLKLYYDLGIGTSYTHLKELIQTLNDAPDETFAETAIQLFDTMSVLNWFVANTITMMGDSYNKNYNLYRDTTRLVHQWIVLPWDYDLSWGRSGDLTKPYPSSLLNDGFTYTFPPLSGPSNVLKDRWLATPRLKEMFLLRLKYVLDSIFTEQRYHQKIDSLAALIVNEVAKDNYKWGTMQDFYEHIEAIKYYVTVRRNYIYKTFINPPSGTYNIATQRITQTNTPYHFTTYDGRTIATIWFTNFSGLDSVTIYAHTDSTPPFVSNPAAQRFIKRFIRIIPHPSSATFSAKLQFMYKDIQANQREVGIGVQDERLLRPSAYNETYWVSLAGRINSFANTVTIDNITNEYAGYSKFVSAIMPETYTQKWYKQPNNLWHKLYDVKFTDYQNGYATGDHGIFIRTTNSGVSWTENQIGLNLPFYKFANPTSGTFHAVSEHGAIYSSSDNGDTWIKQSISAKQNIHSITMNTQQNGWVVGDKGLVASTSDSAKTWNAQYVDTTKNFFDVAMFIDGKAVVVGTDGSVYFSTDNVNVWELRNQNLTTDLHAVKILGDAQIFVVGDSGTVVTSANRGASWTNISVPTTSKLYNLSIINVNSFYVVGEGGKIYYTNNSGLNWYSQYSADSHDLYAVSFVDSAYGIAVGNDGTVLKTTEPGTLNGGTPPIAQIPDNFRLYQNYPNPFNPKTTIEYDLPIQAWVTIKVYNVLGQEVATLVDEIKSADKHSVEFYAVKYASGVYFYRIQVGKNFADTKKLLLLK
jgi:photosystem II stability/assembly factor-like uncharacterized protein/spore coat protein CotH